MATRIHNGKNERPDPQPFHVYAAVEGTIVWVVALWCRDVEAFIEREFTPSARKHIRVVRWTVHRALATMPTTVSDDLVDAEEQLRVV